MYQILCYFRIFPIKHIWMVWLHLFTKTRKVFGLCFHCQKTFARLKISNRPRMRLVCLPPSNSYKFVSKDMILRERWKNIYNKLVYLELFSWRSTSRGINSTIGVGEIKDPNFGTRWVRLIKNNKFKRPKLRKSRLLLSGELLYGMKMKNKNHHLHRCPCTTSIHINKIYIWHLIYLQLLL